MTSRWAKGTSRKSIELRPLRIATGKRYYANVPHDLGVGIREGLPDARRIDSEFVEAAFEDLPYGTLSGVALLILMPVSNPGCLKKIKEKE
jgi:hypothetical protein